ncbi:DUF1810 domain-containing protein [Leeuwenhoekiella sp. A16]|uniref:DUF1810 domain-containing protein n=1 Tax=unclassified Leeuwenhoekiella TaxID=2615029 RepID=UPI003A802D73
MKDSYDLERFIKAQDHSYETALNEIKNGRKQSHWMWFIFPQFKGLGQSATSKQYAIKSKEEAKAFFDHAILGPRLVEITNALLELKGLTAHAIFGSPDDLKLKSCMTLFTAIQEKNTCFQEVLDKYYAGKQDDKTLKLLEEN